MNPFETLGLRPTFALTKAQLELRQRELNRALHPDQHATKTPAERRRALNMAMDVNQAYRKLVDPASRAEVLLGLLGAPSSENQSVTDPALLMEMLELRESLDEMRKRGDREGLGALEKQMLERERQVSSALGAALEPLVEAKAAGPEPQRGVGTDAPSPAARATELKLAPELERARTALAELRYVRRLREEAAALLDEA